MRAEQTTEGLRSEVFRDLWAEGALRLFAVSTLALWLVSLCSVTGQEPPPDADRSQWSVQRIGPNGTWTNPTTLQSRAAFRLSKSTRRRWDRGYFVVEGQNGAPCDLIIDSGSEGWIGASRFEVRGDVFFDQGGVLHVADSQFQTLTPLGAEYNFNWRGGHLDTTRTEIGGKEAVSVLRLWAGLWTARDTVVSYSAGVLVGGRVPGRGAAPLQVGGVLDADGLYQGVQSDFVSVVGHGQVKLNNSSFGIALTLYDGGSTSGSNVIPLNVKWGQVVKHQVYGDKAFHSGVTAGGHLPGSRSRLELNNSTITKWTLVFHDIEDEFRARTYVLEGADLVGIGLQGRDKHRSLKGAPQLVGPWRNFYPSPMTLPGLPTVEPPGFHGIPPGCGVQIGSVTIASPAQSWSYVDTWNLYLDGPKKDYRIDGPGRLVELFMWDGAMSINGGDAYGIGLYSTKINIRGQARLSVQNALIGTPLFSQGQLQVEGSAFADLQLVNVKKLRLRTKMQEDWGPNQRVNRGIVNLKDHLESRSSKEPLTTLISAGGQGLGTIQVAPEQTRNLDFEGTVTNGIPVGWQASGVNGWRASTVRPNSPSGSVSYGYRATSSSGRIWKAIKVPSGARVELFGWARKVKFTNGSMEFVIRGSSGRESKARPVFSGTSWGFIRLPIYEVQPTDSHITIEVRHSGAKGTFEVAIDDLDLRVYSWWEGENLSNLGFEEPRVHRVMAPGSTIVPPDFWNVLGTHARIEKQDSIKGQSIELTSVHRKVVLSKRLSFMPKGSTVVVSGYLKAVSKSGSPFWTWAYVGDGDAYWATTAKMRIQSGTGWQPFKVEYKVPLSAQPYSTFAIAGGLKGDQILVDEVTVEVK